MNKEESVRALSRMGEGGERMGAPEWKAQTKQGPEADFMGWQVDSEF